MRVIAIANQKGGCGKTTTSINLSACLSRLGKKVLLIDLDPQGHSTCGLGIKAELRPYTVYELLHSSLQVRQKLDELLVAVENRFFVLPSHSSLANAEEEWVNQWDRDKKLIREIRYLDEQILDFDFAVIDCPPNLGVLTYNAFEAADEIIIPIEPSFFSLHGLAKISETLDKINRMKSSPMAVHALLTIFDSRTCFSKEIYDEVKRHFREKLFRTIIHESVAFKEAAAAGQHIVQYAPESSAAKDYQNLAVEFLERQWDSVLPTSELGWKNHLANLYGPKKVMGGILFQFPSPEARTVEIAGDFNGWIPETLVHMSGPGIWQKVIPIVKGTYRYKYIVDGEWSMDPCCPVKRENIFGTFDSYLELA